MVSSRNKAEGDEDLQLLRSPLYVLPPSTPECLFFAGAKRVKRLSKNQPCCSDLGNFERLTGKEIWHTML